MMLLYADVYCQSNCLSVPGCQVLRGVIHNNNRAKAESGHWTGDLKKPVRDLGKFPTHHRSPAHPILSSALLQVAQSKITLRRTVYKQYSVVNLIFKRLSGSTAPPAIPAPLFVSMADAPFPGTAEAPVAATATAAAVR